MRGLGKTSLLNPALPLQPWSLAKQLSKTEKDIQTWGHRASANRRLSCSKCGAMRPGSQRYTYCVDGGSLSRIMLALMP